MHTEYSNNRQYITKSNASPKKRIDLPKYDFGMLISDSCISFSSKASLSNSKNKTHFQF